MCAESTQYPVYTLNITVIKYLSKSCLQSIKKNNNFPTMTRKIWQNLAKLTDEVFKFCCLFAYTRQVHNRQYGRMADHIRLNIMFSAPVLGRLEVFIIQLLLSLVKLAKLFGQSLTELLSLSIMCWETLCKQRTDMH